MHYVVVEIQKTDSIATIVNSYDDRNEAVSRYHTILASAAISSVPKHSAVLLTEEGHRIMSESFDHSVEQDN